MRADRLSTPVYKATDAAARVGVSVGSIHREIRLGRLPARRNEQGITVVGEADLDSWNVSRSGGRDTEISLLDASKICQEPILRFRSFVQRGGLRARHNARGQLVLQRDEFLKWNAKQPPLLSQLDPRERWLTLDEVGDRIGLSGKQARVLMKRCQVPLTLCRAPHWDYRMSENNLEKWLQAERAQMIPLDGQPLSLKEAAKRYGVKLQSLRTAVDNGWIAARRELHNGAHRVMVGSLAVEQFLRPQKPKEYWTLLQAWRFSGLNLSTVVNAAERGELPCQTLQKNKVIEPDDLLQWMAARGLPAPNHPPALQWISREEAATLAGVPLERISACIRTGRLDHRKLGGCWAVSRSSVLAMSCKAVVSIQEAARRAGVELKVVYSDMRSGLISGILTSGQYFFTPEAVESWMEVRFHRQGGTRAPGMVSLREAARRSGLAVTFWRTQIELANFSRCRNPAGELILRESELVDWLERQPARPQSSA